MAIQLEEALNVYLLPLQEQLKWLHGHYQEIQDLECQFSKIIGTDQKIYEGDVRAIELSYEMLYRKELPPVLSPSEFTASLSIPAQDQVHQKVIYEELQKEAKFLKDSVNQRDQQIEVLVTEHNNVVSRTAEEMKMLKKSMAE
jgi:hypothetical protein